MSSVIRNCLKIRRKMRLNAGFFLALLAMAGVFGAERDNETMSVGVMEGDSVTLHSDFKEIKRNDYIMWMFGPDSADIRIAEIFKWSYMLSIYVCDKGRFKDALRLDHKNGSLTIKDIRIEYSGLYKLAIINKRKTSYKRFSVKVYAPLPTPVITRDSSQTQNSQASERSSGSKCVLLCSVRNVTQVTLSYYKGSGLISNISGSALNSTLSLPLEVEYDDKNMYSCVVNNAISSQNAHVNITDLCWQSRQFDNTEDVSLLYCLILLVLIPLALAVIVMILCVCRKRRKAEQEADGNS